MRVCEIGKDKRRYGFGADVWDGFGDFRPNVMTASVWGKSDPFSPQSWGICAPAEVLDGDDGKGQRKLPPCFRFLFLSLLTFGVFFYDNAFSSFRFQSERSFEGCFGKACKWMGRNVGEWEDIISAACLGRIWLLCF